MPTTQELRKAQILPNSSSLRFVSDFFDLCKSWLKLMCLCLNLCFFSTACEMVSLEEKDKCFSDGHHKEEVQSGR